MRGTPADIPRNPRQTGIIPAYAGNTMIRLGLVRLRRDHPRVCGEHIADKMRVLAKKGSSPRMRGTRACGTRPHSPAGIIPAYAGNTRRSGSSKADSGDHPRVCGEHHLVNSRTEYGQGSSPRMRGTLQCRPKRHQPPGIIPAYAGNTPAEC